MCSVYLLFARCAQFNNIAFFFIVTYLKNQWKGLRDGYRCCLQKREKSSRSGAGASKLSRCKFFDQLGFLRDTLLNKDTDTNLPISDNLETSESENKIEDGGTVAEETETVQTKKAKVVQSNQSQLRKPKQNMSIDNLLMQQLQDVNTQVNEIKHNSPKDHGDDPDYLFCSSLVSRLKSLPQKKNRLARMKIEQLLFEIEYGDM